MFWVNTTKNAMVFRSLFGRGGEGGGHLLLLLCVTTTTTNNNSVVCLKTYIFEKRASILAFHCLITVPDSRKVHVRLRLHFLTCF